MSANIRNITVGKAGQKWEIDLEYQDIETQGPWTPVTITIPDDFDTLGTIDQQSLLTQLAFVMNEYLGLW